MIPTEVNYAEWFTCAARFYFLKEGYAFLSFELAQVEEQGFPADKLLAAGNRVVGLRFLRPAGPVTGRQTFAYEADDVTRRRMADGPGWLLYALPQSADPLDQQLTHQKVVFAGVAAVESDASDRLIAGQTVTFKQLVAGLEEGALGREVTDAETAGTLLAPARAADATLYLVMNRRERTIIVLGNQRR